MIISIETVKAIAYASALSSLLPVLSDLIKGQRIAFYKFIRIYVWCSLCFEAVFTSLGIAKINNLYMLPLIAFTECVLLTMYFDMNIGSVRLSRVLKVWLVLISLVFIIDIIWFEGIKSNIVIPRTVTNAGLIGLSVISFYRILSTLQITNLIGSSIFWFNTAILLYFSGNFFVYLFMNYINNDSTEAIREYLIIHSILNITYNILLSVGIWNLKQK